MYVFLYYAVYPCYTFHGVNILLVAVFTHKIVFFAITFPKHSCTGEFKPC